MSHGVSSVWESGAFRCAGYQARVGGLEAAGKIHPRSTRDNLEKGAAEWASLLPSRLIETNVKNFNRHQFSVDSIALDRYRQKRLLNGFLGDNAIGARVEGGHMCGGGPAGARSVEEAPTVFIDQLMRISHQEI